MKEISKEYVVLFNSISNTISELDILKDKLIRCQQLAEEIYIGGELVDN